MTGYTVERTTTVTASPHRVHALVDDFHHWTLWSPWEDLDPDLRRTYTGPDRGVGAHYAWSGNRKAGRGAMEIVDCRPDAVEIRVEFVKPFRATNLTRISVEPSDSGTLVRWAMTGEHHGLMGLFGRVLNIDKLIGPDFEKGLARLKAAAEESERAAKDDAG
jgi:hypothetical protein